MSAHEPFCTPPTTLSCIKRGCLPGRLFTGLKALKIGLAREDRSLLVFPGLKITTVRKDSHLPSTLACKDSHLGRHRGSRDSAKEKVVRPSKEHLFKIALHLDHAVELDVTDRAGESDLTVTLSAASSLSTTYGFVELAAAFDVVICGRNTGRKLKSAAALAG